MRETARERGRRLRSTVTRLRFDARAWERAGWNETAESLRTIAAYLERLVPTPAAAQRARRGDTARTGEPTPSDT